MENVKYFQSLDLDNMIRKYILIGIFFFTMSFKMFAYFDNEEFFSLKREMHGVKMVTEKGRFKSKIVSYFDKEGFLLHKIYHYKNEIRADYRYEYFISDTLIEIKEKNYRNINNDSAGHLIYKYYYNSLGQCYKYEVYSSRNLEKSLGVSDNFIYQDGLLQSYEIHNPNLSKDEYYKVVYKYESNQRSKLRYCINKDSIFIASCESTSIYENNKLTDFIRECGEGGAIISGEIWWSKNRKGKVHIKYASFDKHENWKKSYFLTEKRKAFRSKRKIEYW